MKKRLYRCAALLLSAAALLSGCNGAASFHASPLASEQDAPVRQPSDEAEPARCSADENEPVRQSADGTAETAAETAAPAAKPFAHVPSYTAVTEAAPTVPFPSEKQSAALDIPDEMQLPVENILQMPALPNGCEVVSLAICLNYMGYPVSATVLADDFLPKGAFGQVNPQFTYVGDPRGDGFGCYAPCILQTNAKYLRSINVSGVVANNISGSTPEQLKAWVAKGWPVILWATVDMNHSPVAVEWDFEGNRVCWYSGSHCVVISGYTKDSYTICDPLRGVVVYDREKVEKAYSLIGSQAVVLYEKEIIQR